jgi:Flp pilus assembly protein TadB
VKALTSQTMTSANTLALFPTLFVIFLSYVTPGYLDPLFETSTGTFILRAAAGLNFVGWILCRQMAVVKL